MNEIPKVVSVARIMCTSNNYYSEPVSMRMIDFNNNQNAKARKQNTHMFMILLIVITFKYQIKMFYFF